MPTITNRPSTSANATATATATPAKATEALDDAAALPSTSTPAATFEGTSAPKKSAPFSPPSPPQLRNEDEAMSGTDRERIREANESRIKDYNKAYGAYLETYVEGVEAAPNLDRVRAFGPPVDYDPAASLPVSQRKAYDHMHKAKLANATVVHEAIGERVLKETGHKLPGAYAFGDVKATVFGNGVKGRASVDDEGWHSKGSTQLGLNSKFIEPDAKAFGEKIGVGITTNIDMETGEAKTAVQARAGMFGIEADEAGKLTVDGGVDVGGAALKAGSSYDGKNRRAEAFIKGGLKAGDVLEVEAKLGVGVQFLTNDYVKDVIDPNDVGFFDKTKLIGGR